MSYYTSLMFGHAEGKTVASKMMAQFKEDNMPIHNLRTLVRDGPNVNDHLQNDGKEHQGRMQGFSWICGSRKLYPKNRSQGFWERAAQTTR